MRTLSQPVVGMSTLSSLPSPNEGRRRDAVMLHGGGLDSLVLLGLLSHAGYNVHCLGLNYGQINDKELRYMTAQTLYYSANGVICDISSLQYIMGGNLMLDRNADRAQSSYRDPKAAQWVVPNRNALFTAIAWAWACTLNADLCGVAFYSDGATHFPDTTPEFARDLERVFAIGTTGHRNAGLELYAPFMGWNKAQVVHVGRLLDVPFDLAWSCYYDDEKPCDKCPACVKRREAMTMNDIAEVW